MIDHITTLEIVIALLVLLVEMILNRFPMMHPEGYSNTETRASDSYGYDQSSSSSGIAYRGFGYYQSGVDPEQPLKPYFPDYGSSSQSSQPTYSSYEQLF